MIRAYAIAVFTFVFIVNSFTIEAQCDPANCGHASGVIRDKAISYFPIHISGIVNDDLANSNQHLSRVYLDIKHDRIGDINVYLRSPNNTKIQILGTASNTNSHYTNLIRWKVCFYPDEITVIPDAGQDEVWNNFPNVQWETFHTYTGQYKPHSGSLNDFDSGPVNGDWLLIIEDIDIPQDGVVLDFSLQFEDESGMSCTSCDPPSSDIMVEKDTLCLNESIKDFVSFTLNGGLQNDTFYNYRYLLIDMDEIIRVDTLVDLSGLDIGTYSICGLAYSTSYDLDILGLTYDSLTNLIMDKTICAELSNSCREIVIKDVGSIDTVHVDLCIGDIYEFQGVIYDTTGRYFISQSERLCEDVLLLDIQLFDEDRSIYSIGPNTLDCNTPFVFLSIDPLLKGTLYNTLWFTEDGYFNSDVYADTVEVSKGGIYYYTWSTDNCSDTVSFLVEEVGSLTNLSIVTEYITCDTVKAYYVANNDVDKASIKWFLADNSIHYGVDTVFFVESGWLRFTAEDEDDCRISVAKEVIGMKLDTFHIEIDSIGCLQDTAYIEVLNPNEAFDFMWLAENGEEIAPFSMFKTVKEGVYYLKISSPYCSFFDTISIVKRGSFPKLQTFNVDSLSCEQDSVQIILDYDQLGLAFDWKGPYSFSSTDSNPFVKYSGYYYLDVMSAQGCITKDSFYVPIKSDKPILIAHDTLIGCDQDSVKLLVNVTALNPSYLWSGPNGFSSTILEPYVMDTGIYKLVVTDQDACMGQAELRLSKVEFSLTYKLSADTFNCYMDPINIINSLGDNQGVAVTWTGPESFISHSTSLMDIAKAGWYYLQMKDDNECQLLDSIEVVEDIMFPQVFAGNDTVFNCIQEPLTLNGVEATVEEGDIVLWSSDNMGVIDNNTSLSPTIHENGVYYISVKRKVNGCVGVDTIEVTSNGDLALNIGNDTVVFPGAIIPISIDMNTPLNTLTDTKWQSDVGSLCDFCLSFDFEALETTNISLQVTDASGCTAMTSRYIKVIETEDVFIPNVFSVSQGDSYYFRLDFLPHVVHVIDASIYDRWGDLVYQKPDFYPATHSFKWDGMFKGELVSSGVYVVMVKYELKDGNIKTQIGSVAFLR